LELVFCNNFNSDVKLPTAEQMLAFYYKKISLYNVPQINKIIASSSCCVFSFVHKDTTRQGWNNSLNTTHQGSTETPGTDCSGMEGPNLSRFVDIWTGWIAIRIK